MDGTAVETTLESMAATNMASIRPPVTRTRRAVQTTAEAAGAVVTALDYARVGGGRASAQARVEGVADRVAEDVRGEHRQEDARPGQEDQPRRVDEVLLRVAEHVPPARRGRVDAEAEVVQRGLGQDHAAHAQAGGHDEHRPRVGARVPDARPG